MKLFFERVFAFVCILCVFTSCEVEFDPNEEWKAVTIVYGLLDQDEDTTFVFGYTFIKFIMLAE